MLELIVQKMLAGKEIMSIASSIIVIGAVIEL
jgi:hypothetical protein